MNLSNIPKFNLADVKGLKNSLNAANVSPTFAKRYSSFFGSGTLSPEELDIQSKLNKLAFFMENFDQREANPFLRTLGEDLLFGLFDVKEVENTIYKDVSKITSLNPLDMIKICSEILNFINDCVTKMKQNQ